MIYVSDCLDISKMFGAIGAGKPLKLLVTCDQNLSVGHRMLWPSHYGMAFVSNTVDFEDQSFGETVSASERPSTLLAVDLVLQIRSHFHFFLLRFFMLYNACCMPGAKLEPRKRGLQ